MLIPQLVSGLNNTAHTAITKFPLAASNTALQTAQSKDLGERDKTQVQFRLEALSRYFLLERPTLRARDVAILTELSKMQGLEDYYYEHKKHSLHGWSSLEEANDAVLNSRAIISDAEKGRLTPQKAEEDSVNYLKQASAKLFAAQTSFENAQKSFSAFDARVRELHSKEQEQKVPKEQEQKVPKEQEQKVQKIRDFLDNMIKNIIAVNTDLWNKLRDNGLL